MVTVKKYGGKVTQTSGAYSGSKHYRTWTNLSNIKYNGNNYATCGVTSSNSNYTLIGGKNGTWNRPSTISLTNFGFDIPSGAKITQIRVGYIHKKNKYGGTYGSFAAPTISLLNTKYSKKGYAVPTSAKAFITNFAGSFTSKIVNNSNFGVRINYPANTTTNVSQIELKDVWVEITYSDFKFTVNATSNVEDIQVGDTADITVTLTSQNGALSSYSSAVNFIIPDGVSFIKKTAGNGTIEKNGTNFVWKGDFQRSKEISITFQIQATAAGNNLITFTEIENNASTKLLLKISEKPKAELQVLYDNTQTENEDFEVIFTISAVESVASAAQITFEEGLNIIEHTSDDFSPNDPENGVYTFQPLFDYTNQTFAAYNFKIRCGKSGKYTFTVTFNNKTTTYSIKVKPSGLSKPYFVSLELDEKELDRMGDGKQYTISSILKILMEDEDLDLFETYDYNYRVGVFNSEDNAEYTVEDYFKNSFWSEPVTAPNSEELTEVNFYYNEGNRVIIFITGEYLEVEARAVKLQYTYPIVMETEFKTNLENPGIFPYPIKKLGEVEEYSISDLETQTITNNIRAYALDVGGLVFNENTVVQGITVDFDLNCDSEFAIIMKLITKDKVGQRSININTTNGSATIGGEFDLWGLDFEDFMQDNLEELELELNLLDPFNHDTHVEINNLHITFHYIEVAESVVKAYVNGKDLRYYNMFLEEITVPAGTENEVKYLNVEGTDSTLAYRSNIKKKKIKIKFIVSGCDINETSKFLERIGRLFSNERDKFNKPILNTIEFSNYPDRIWYFLIEDAIDADVELTEYEGKIELIIPAGTSYSKNITVTNAYGVNSSIAKINPELYVVATADEISITEENSQQKFTIHGEDLAGNLLRIDCANRKVFKLTDNAEVTGEYINTDITKQVDFNSDWFIVYGEYHFNCNNTANMQSVRFYERW